MAVWFVTVDFQLGWCIHNDQFARSVLHFWRRTWPPDLGKVGMMDIRYENNETSPQNPQRIFINIFHGFPTIIERTNLDLLLDEDRGYLPYLFPYQKYLHVFWVSEKNGIPIKSPSVVTMVSIRRNPHPRPLNPSRRVVARRATWSIRRGSPYTPGRSPGPDPAVLTDHWYLILVLVRPW